MNKQLLAAVGVLAVLLLVGVGLLAWPRENPRTITAEFPETVSLYEGSDVRILGVPVGEVTRVTPVGTKVVAELEISRDYKLPADVRAAIVSPSVVGDRFIQLTPAYRSGPELKNNATLGLNRTGTPLELDEIFSSLNDLNRALGPDGANKEGALSSLLSSTAKNFGGQGEQLNTTIKNFGKFSQTLADNKDNLFATARDVQAFLDVMAKNDQTVRRFNDSLRDGSAMLVGERQDLAAALDNLGVAMGQVQTFVRENRASLGRNIKGLNRLSRILVKRRAELDETLRVAPTALANLGLSYNGRTGTLDTRANIGEVASKLQTDPRLVLCTLLNGQPAQLCGTNNGAMPKLPGQGRVPALAPMRLSPQEKQAARAQVTVVEKVDRSLGGLIEEGPR